MSAPTPNAPQDPIRSDPPRADTVHPPPPNGPPRNIVILLDGTGNQFSSRNSNLIKLMSVVKADEGQLLYYSSGLGESEAMDIDLVLLWDEARGARKNTTRRGRRTWVGTVLPVSTSTWGVVRQKAAELIDLALAWNFDQFVQDAYKYLMDVYKTGDRIYLFGFSRGAYTARALAGMIQRVGLLNPGNHNQIPLAYKLYTSESSMLNAKGEAKDPAVLYRRIFGRSRPVSIEFMGVWDTVSSLGGVDLPRLPFASGAKSIKFFRHALALDERRARFVPEYWRIDEAERAIRHELDHLRKTASNQREEAEAQVVRDKVKALEERLEREYPQDDVVVLGGKVMTMRKNVEVWFRGCHSDVGGGNDLNDGASLSNIPFRWMLREAVQCGLLLDPCGVALQTALKLPLQLPDTPPKSITPLVAVQPINSTQDPFNVPGAGHPLDENLNALTRLAELLEAQSNDSKKELDDWAECKRLIGLLPQEVLADIVQAAAAADVAGYEGVSSGSAGDGDGRSEEVVLGEDNLRDVKESLTTLWWILEVLPLQTRHYTPEGAKATDIWRINFGRGRQIIPGQKLHRSVGLRMIRDASNAAGATHGLGGHKGQKYIRPKAAVAAGWPTWSDVGAGRVGVAETIWAD